MLSYALAIAVALSSLVLFLTAFFMSDIHRKDDFLWSAVGLFYALVMWFCARNITGAVLLGQASASVLLISFVWQTLKLRKAIANPDRAIAISNFSLLQGVNNLLKGKNNKPQPVTNRPVQESADLVTESEISIPETTSNKKESPVIDDKVTPKKISKGGSFGKFFGGKKKSMITNTKLDEILDEDPEEIQPEISPQNETKPVSIPRQTPSEVSISETKDDTQISEDKEEKEANKPKEADKPKQIVDRIVKDSVKEDVTVDISDILGVEKPNLEINENTETQEVEDSVKEETTVAIQPEKSPEIEIADSSENVIENDSEQTTNLGSVETKTEVELSTTEIAEEKPVIAEKTMASPLDSLETVEVAEVLEALPEDLSGDINNNQNNIIEVTSTDIDRVIESQQPDASSKSEEENEQQ